MAEKSHDRLRALARRAADESFFLASALRAYAESEEMNDEDLARFLGCPVEALDPIRLCRRPVSDSPEFPADVKRIAERFGLRVEGLAQIVRQVDVLAALRREDVPATGELRAARDREPEDGDDEEKR